MLLRLNDLSLHFDGRPILREVHFRLAAGERVGLIGPNGSGKTSVLQLIRGELEPSAGAVQRSQDLRIGYFSQHTRLDGSRSAQECLDALFADIRELQLELAEIEHRIDAGAESSQLEGLLARQTHLFDQMAHRDGWNVELKIDTALTRLGFSQRDRHLPADQLSGGWRNRAALAEILLAQPDLLLLDEPTNYLDVDGLAWLETWLGRQSCAQLVVSHDRHFLDAVVNRIVEIENHHFHEYGGGFTGYVRQKPLRTKQLARQGQHERELLALESEAIEERRIAARDPGKSLRRKLARAKKGGTRRLVDKIITDIYAKLRFPDQLLEVRDLTLERDERTLCRDVSFTLQSGDRLAVLGPNGCGKTTLLSCLKKQIEPRAGELRWLPGIRWKDFNDVLAELPAKETVQQRVGKATREALTSQDAPPRKSIAKFLSLLQLSELDQKAPLGVLSGGQRSRVALASCLVSGAPVLLLDEPTNHLDVTSTQVMERALAHFPGAVIVVSHDRFFIDKIATRLLVFRGEDGATQLFEGSWSMWSASARD